MERRDFITANAGMFLSGIFMPVTGSSFSSFNEEKKLNSGKAEELAYGISQLPNFCAHEHWGSIAAIGSAPEQNGYRADTMAGAKPVRPVSVWDLVLDPYALGWMRLAGLDPNAEAIAKGYKSQQEWWEKSPDEALRKFSQLMQTFLLTGGFQCARRGIKLLYNTDIAQFKTEIWQEADKLIKEKYSGIFSWYTSAMKKAHFSGLIRPVHPEFYVRPESEESAREEASFTNTVLRIDPLLDLWKTKDKRRDDLSAITGIDPADAAGYREFIKRIFDIAGKNGAVGIKQLQGYRRSFQFTERSDKEVLFRGELTPAEVLVFQDWVMHECCRQANERQWVHQVHVGTHNLGQSNPLPLEELSRKYAKMKIVLIHCWPFINEAGWLAKMRSNIYLDCNWLAVLNPSFLADALRSWLGYVPAHKLMMSHDSTHIEMAAGASLFAREALSAELVNRNKTLRLPDAVIKKTAADMLNNNAVRLYGTGKEYYL